MGENRANLRRDHALAIGLAAVVYPTGWATSCWFVLAGVPGSTWSRHGQCLGRCTTGDSPAGAAAWLPAGHPERFPACTLRHDLVDHRRLLHKHAETYVTDPSSDPPGRSPAPQLQAPLLVNRVLRPIQRDPGNGEAGQNWRFLDGCDRMSIKLIESLPRTHVSLSGFL